MSTTSNVPYPRTLILSVDPPIVGGVIDDARPIVSGKAPQNAQVQLWLNGAVAATGFADSLGSWTISLPPQLNGAYSLIARSIPGSPALTFNIEDPLQPLLSATGVAAIFDMDRGTGVYFHNGFRYASDSDLLGAVGGTLDGQRLVTGPYVDPLGTEYLTNGTFDAVTTGWLTYVVGTTIAIVSGELQADATTAGGAVSQGLSGYGGRAFAFSGTGRRGTNAANSPYIAGTTQNNALSGNLSEGTPVTGSNTTSTVYVSSANGVTTWFGIKYGVSFGTTLWDNFQVREVLPMAGWADFAGGISASAVPSYSVLIEGVAPASLPGAGLQKIIWQGDVGHERDRIKLYWDESGNVMFSTASNNIQILASTVGALAANAPFRVALGVARGAGAAQTGFVHSLNGGNPVINQGTGMICPGIAYMRVGKNVAGGNLWDGTITRVAIVPGHQPADWLEAKSALGAYAWSEGDSYMDGAGGVTLKNLLQTALGYPVVNSAVGGSTLAAIRTRILSKSYLRDRPLIVWDGSANGFTDVPTSLALMQEVRDWKGDSNIIWMASINTPNPAVASSPTVSAYTALLEDLRDAAITAFGSAHVYDPLPVLQALGNGGADDNNDIAAGLVPRSLLLTQNSGEVHLGSTAMSAIANDAVLLAKIAAID